MSILFLGTSSGAGKTTVCAMMCRYLKRSGIDVAPFKGSNLSLNSIATKDGGEIGIGQAFQAWAAGIEPDPSHNTSWCLSFILSYAFFISEMTRS